MEKTYRILKLMIWVLLFAVLMVGAYVLYNNLSSQVNVGGLATQPTSETEGESKANAAPDFTVYDLEGNPHKLSDFRGKPVILNFWASWCGPCKSEMPDFEDAYQEYGEQIHFLMVNLTDGSKETVESASGYISGQGYTFPVYYDTDMEAAMTYGVYAVPQTYFIDGDGNIVTYAQGALPASSLQQGVDLLLK